MTLLTIYLVGFLLHFTILALNVYRHQRHQDNYHWYAYIGIAFTGFVWPPFWLYIVSLKVWSKRERK